MERRTFIKQAAAGITFTGLAGFGFGSCTTNGGNILPFYIRMTLIVI